MTSESDKCYGMGMALGAISMVIGAVMALCNLPFEVFAYGVGVIAGVWLMRGGERAHSNTPEPIQAQRPMDK